MDRIREKSRPRDAGDAFRRAAAPAAEITGGLGDAKKIGENLRITRWKNHYHNFFLLTVIRRPAFTPAQRDALLIKKHRSRGGARFFRGISAAALHISATNSVRACDENYLVRSEQRAS